VERNLKAGGPSVSIISETPFYPACFTLKKPGKEPRFAAWALTVKELAAKRRGPKSWERIRMHRDQNSLEPRCRCKTEQKRFRGGKKGHHPFISSGEGGLQNRRLKSVHLFQRGRCGRSKKGKGRRETPLRNRGERAQRLKGS